ncbi:MAG: aminotransferase class V-fold PLP-dependent enzyme, partial [Clostridia bacterium]|nr:aminotransferase class V-fold PLP-dependent enzyme [Clostridia bacterium]
PVIFGGGQQHGIRPGTENVPGIAGLGTAAAHCFAKSAEAALRMSELKERLKNSLMQNIDNIRVNTPEKSAPHILNVSFGGVKSEVLLHSLENEGIYVSSGSACSSHKKEPSYVLTEIGVDRAMIDGSIRFSLCEFTTAEDIDKTAAATADIVKRLRKLNLR